MWKTSCTVLLLVLFVALSPLFSLTEEEKEVLPTLSKDKLIQIIMNYDKSLTETESNLPEREKLLAERESDLKKRNDLMMQSESGLVEREKTLTETESHIRLRENLLAESYRLQKEANSQNFWTGITYGGVGGVALGLIASQFIVR